MTSHKSAIGTVLLILPALLQAETTNAISDLEERVKAEGARLKQLPVVTSYTLTVVQQPTNPADGVPAQITTQTATGTSQRLNMTLMPARALKRELSAFAPDARYHKSQMEDGSLESQYGFDGSHTHKSTQVQAKDGQPVVTGSRTEGRGPTPPMLPVHMFFTLPEEGEREAEAVDTSCTIRRTMGNHVTQASFEMGNAPAPLELIAFRNGAMTNRYEFAKHTDFEGFRLPTEVRTTFVNGPLSVVTMEYSGIEYKAASAEEVKEMAQFPVPEEQ